MYVSFKRATVTVAASWGKALESELWTSWGRPPTLQVLRRRDKSDTAGVVSPAWVRVPAAAYAERLSLRQSTYSRATLTRR